MSKLKLKPHKSGIYQIRNLVNEKVYIGSAVNLIHRINTHKSKLKLNYHPSKHLQAAWNKYGEQAFVFEIIEYCDKDKLIEREQFYLDKIECVLKLYNKRKIAVSNFGWRGWKQDKEWIEKRISKLRGRKDTPKQIEAKRKRQTGKVISEETKKKISEKSKAQIWTQERKNKISKALANLDKWPHGYKCNCRNCLNKKNEDRKQNRIKSKQDRINKSPKYVHLKEINIIQW